MSVTGSESRSIIDPNESVDILSLIYIAFPTDALHPASWQGWEQQFYRFAKHLPWVHCTVCPCDYNDLDNCEHGFNDQLVRGLKMDTVAIRHKILESREPELFWREISADFPNYSEESREQVRKRFLLEPWRWRLLNFTVKEWVLLQHRYHNDIPLPLLDWANQINELELMRAMAAKKLADELAEVKNREGTTARVGQLEHEKHNNLWDFAKAVHAVIYNSQNKIKFAAAVRVAYSKETHFSDLVSSSSAGANRKIKRSEQQYAIGIGKPDWADKYDEKGYRVKVPTTDKLRTKKGTSKRQT